MNNPIKSFGATFLVVILLTGCGSTTAPSSPPSTQPPATETLSLTVEEYAIVDDSVDKPTHFEFMDRVDPKIKAKRKAIRESSFKPDVARMNQTLERFGYMALEHEPRLRQRLRHRLVLRSLHRANGQRRNPSRRDLNWDERKHIWTGPVYMGDDLAWATANDDWKSYRLEREGETFYEGRMPEPSVDTPFKAFVAWDGHWATEVNGDVIVDGQSVGKAKGYDKVFTLRLIKDKPFYFYSKGGKIHLSYDGQTPANTYDEVIHYRCCEPAAFNPGANDSMVWFWARKGSMWHYVEAGVYD